jgi:hypothetical protein
VASDHITYTWQTCSLSQSEAHCTDVTVDEWTNSQSQHRRPAGYVASVPVMWHVTVIFFSSTVVFSPSGQFLVMPLLHSVSISRKAIPRQSFLVTLYKNVNNFKVVWNSKYSLLQFWNEISFSYKVRKHTFTFL